MNALKPLVAAALVLGLGGCAIHQPTEVADKEAAVAKNCLRDTGSRIKPKAGEERCVNAPGRVITAEDIERSGATSVGDAIERIRRR